MSGPWEAYQTPAVPAPEGPWTAYQASRGAVAESDPATAYKDESKPWYSRIGMLADDIVRTAANGATFGFADKIAGYLGGEGTEAERAKSKAAEERLGTPAATVAELAGGVAPVAGLARAGITATRLVPQSMTGGAGLAARTGAMATEGAGYGALGALGHDQDVATGAALGAGAGAVGNVAGEAIATGVGKAAGLFNKKPPVPETEELFRRGEAAYQRADQAGLVIKPEGIQRLAAEVKSDLANNAYDPALAPKIKVVLDRLDELSQGNVTLKGVDTLRKIANANVDPGNAFEAKLSGDVVRRIDDFLDNLDATHVLMGNKTEGVMALREARQNWAMARKSEIVEDAVERATLQAQSAGSGGNIDNALRQQFKDILKNPKRSRGFTEDERDAMRQIVAGTTPQNLARLLGKLSPEGNGLMLTIQAVGGMATGGASLPAAAVGAAAKRFGDQATHNNVYALARVIKNGGSAEPAIQNAVQRLTEAERETLSRILTQWGVQTTSGAASP